MKANKSKYMKATSKKAHKSMQPDGKKAQQDKILQVLKRFKVTGLNYQKIAEKAGMEPVAVGRRLSELVRDNKICEAGTVSKTKSGRIATDWRIVKAA